MLKLLKRFTKTEWVLAGAAFVLILVQVWFNLTMPDYMSEITTLVQTEGSEMNAILTAGGKMLLCALGSLLSAVLITVCAARIASNFSANLRGEIFDQVQSFSMAEIGRFSTASLITRSTNDVTQVQMLIVMGLEVLLKAPVTAVWAICKIYSKNWQWTTATAVAVVVLLSLVGACVAIAMPKFKKLQSLTDNINRVTREDLTGQLVVRAYNAEGYQEEKFKKANDELTHTQLFTSRTMACLFPGIQLVMSGLTLAIYWIGAYLIESAGMLDKLTLFSEMVVFSQYAMQVVMSFMMLVMIFILLPRASVSAKRINEVLETKNSIRDGDAERGKAGQTGEIEFKNVSFRYPDAGEPVLRDISFTAHKGETVAFIGATGSGKSTVINLVPRFYDATEGQVLVDGVDVREYRQAALRSKIGYVSQKAILFSGTVRSNVAYGDNGRDGFLDSDIVEAVATAQASDFVEKMTDGYDGYIALAKDCGGATRLIVAQRIGTIRNADKIIVLDEGRVAGMGTHDELMRTCKVYQEIALSQLSKEELA